MQSLQGNGYQSPCRQHSQRQSLRLSLAQIAKGWRSPFVYPLGERLKIIHFFLAIIAKLVYFINMKTREQLLKDLAFWQDKVNRSRKESLRSIRVLHLQHVQRQLAELEKSS